MSLVWMFTHHLQMKHIHHPQMEMLPLFVRVLAFPCPNTTVCLCVHSWVCVCVCFGKIPGSSPLNMQQMCVCVWGSGMQRKSIPEKWTLCSPRSLCTYASFWPFFSSYFCLLSTCMHTLKLKSTNPPTPPIYLSCFINLNLTYRNASCLTCLLSYPTQGKS